MPAIYVGTNKIKKIYIGTTKIKKVYSGTTLVYNAVPSFHSHMTMSEAKYEVGMANVGSYLLLAGGDGTSPRFKSTVETLNTALVKSTATSLSEGRNPCGGRTASYALFAGGMYYDAGSNIMRSKTVDAYNSSLTRVIAESLYDERSSLDNVNIDGYALFGNGIDNGNGKGHVKAYNNSLVGSIATYNVKAYNRATATAGDYGLFAGGDTYASGTTSAVDAYNSTLSKTFVSALFAPCTRTCGLTINNYALFVGGQQMTNQFANVDIYNSTLVKTTGANLTKEVSNLVGGTIGDYAVFLDAVNMDMILFDKNLVRQDSFGVLPATQRAFSSTGVINDYLISVGGISGIDRYSDINIYN